MNFNEVFCLDETFEQCEPVMWVETLVNDKTDRAPVPVVFNAVCAVLERVTSWAVVRIPV